MCPRETVDHGRHRAWRNRCQCEPTGYKNLFWVRLGKPDGAAYSQRRSWYPRSVYVGTLVLGAAVYRPFCQFICPFGFVSWIVERVSLYRIRVSPTRCNGCGACGAACPTGAAKDIVAGRLLAADCYRCARCLTVCPHDAIRYCRRLEPAEAVSIE